MLRFALHVIAAAFLALSATTASAQNVAPSGRFGDEIAAIVAADAARPSGCPILFIGSSSIRLWGSLSQDMAPYPVVNHGFGGSTIADVNDNFAALIGPQHPRAIFFYAGDNDVAEGKSPEEVVRAFERFLELKSASLGQTPVYFISIKPSPARLAQEPLQRRTNDAVRRLARTRTDVHFIDVASAMERRGAPLPIFVGDGLHLDAGGYALWTRIIRPSVAQAARSACPVSSHR